jgi:hypothetical protein
LSFSILCMREIVSFYSSSFRKEADIDSQRESRRSLLLKFL